MYVYSHGCQHAGSHSHFLDRFSFSKTYDSDVIRKNVCAIRAPNAKNIVPLDKAVSIRGCCNTRSAESTTYIQ